MTVTIDNYRGWEISFNTESESFLAYSDRFDEEIIGKSSFSSIKKYIDEFITNNQKFRPFHLQFNPLTYGINKGTTIKIIGQRKDGKFVYEQKGEKKILSSYDEKYYMLFDEENDKLIKEYNQKLDELDKQRSELLKIIKKKFQLIKKNKKKV
jgi:hypothetical protein